MIIPFILYNVKLQPAQTHPNLWNRVHEEKKKPVIINYKLTVQDRKIMFCISLQQNVFFIFGNWNIRNNDLNVDSDWCFQFNLILPCCLNRMLLILSLIEKSLILTNHTGKFTFSPLVMLNANSVLNNKEELNLLINRTGSQQ